MVRVVFVQAESEAKVARLERELKDRRRMRRATQSRANRRFDSESPSRKHIMMSESDRATMSTRGPALGFCSVWEGCLEGGPHLWPFLRSHSCFILENLCAWIAIML